MKKQTNSNSNDAKNQEKTSRKNPASKNNARYTYTDADLGEDILEISLGMYAAAKRFANNIYGKQAYSFQ